MFGIELIDASLLPAIAVALAAGILSFLSPCVLPIVPPYLAFMGGISIKDLSGEGEVRRSPIGAAVFFVMGLSTVFLLLGFTASAFGRFFLNYAETFNTVAGLIVMIFGGHFLGIYRLGFIERDLRIDAGNRGGTLMGAYLLGLAFAFGWTPCIGPQLGAILSLAASDANLARGTLLLGVYALGLGLPFLAVAAFFPKLRSFMEFMRLHMQRIERIMGLLLWTIGFLMLTGGFSCLSFWLLESFDLLGLPALG
jgi:cytochrome c-type biogenesis protein